jgi:hypothetical protein
MLAVGGQSGHCFAAEPSPALPNTSTAEVERCVEAHDSARVLMLDEKWLEAREGMVRCQDTACPLAIRSDCAAWLEEVTRILPTLLVMVERDDAGTSRVELAIDGKSLELSNPPQPIELPPGTHLVRVRLEPYPPVERIVVLSRGEKNHVVRVRFASEKPPPLPPPAPRPSRPIPVVTYVLAGGAVAAFATSGILLASALTSRNDALERCAPVCTTEEQDSIDARLLAADIFGGVGIVLGGFATYTLLTRPTVYETALAPRLEVSRTGSKLSFGGRF